MHLYFRFSFPINGVLFFPKLFVLRKPQSFGGIRGHPSAEIRSVAAPPTPSLVPLVPVQASSPRRVRDRDGDSFSVLLCRTVTFAFGFHKQQIVFPGVNGRVISRGVSGECARATRILRAVVGTDERCFSSHV